MLNYCRLTGWLRTIHAVQCRLSVRYRSRRARLRHRGSFDAACERLEARQLLSAGTIDPTFGAGGEVTTSFVGELDEADMVLVQSDGHLVVSGTARNGTTTNIVLARYTTEGTLDNAFG